MLTHLRPAVVMTVLFTLLTGLAYPLAMTGLAQVVAPAQAKGSLVTRDNIVLGSKLIGQSFTSERYFHGRPSAAGKNGYDATASSGSNLGPTSKALIERVTASVAALRTAGAVSIPADAVTASGSGLDPHISPAYAAMQSDRVAKARNVSLDRVRSIVTAHTEQPFFGIFGEPRVNVLMLNLALDAETASGAP
jgi:K+-transporting ATPase ATPase C chain